MKKNFKYILISLLLLLLIPTKVLAMNVVHTNEENNAKVVLEDDADLLSDEEEKKLTDKMISLTRYGHVVFKTISENPTDAESYARNYFYEAFGNVDGEMFLIDMDTRRIAIYSSGKNKDVITRGKANTITDNIYLYASRENYYQCAYEAFDQIYTVLDGGRIAEPMKNISNVLISLSLSFLIMFGIVISSSRIKKATNKEVLKGVSTTFNVDQLSAVKTGERRVYNPPSSSGGSSGGGGGGGGGGGSGSSGSHGF